MRWSLLTVKVAIAIVSLISTLILLLTVLPLATGGLKIDMPQEGDVQWEMDGDLIHADVPVKIYNGGILAIEDFALSANMTDVDGTHLSTTHSIPVDLVTNAWTEVVLPVDIDLSVLSAEKRLDIVFNGTEVYLKIGLQSYFGLRTIYMSIDGDGNQTMEVPALITDLDVDPADLRLITTSSGPALDLPYSFGASDLLVGKTIRISSNIFNSSGLLSHAQEEVLIQSTNYGDLVYPLDEEAFAHLLTQSDRLRFEVMVVYDDLSYMRIVQYDWVPPLTGFEVTGAMQQGDTILLSYSFQASPMVQGLTLNVQLVIDDEVGLVGQGSDDYVIFPNNQQVMVLQVVPDAVGRLIEPAEWKITFTMTLQGFTSSYTIPYHWNGGL